MYRWLIRMGILCLVAGMVIVSPLTDWLPVDLFLKHRDSEGHAVFFRVVPTHAQAGDISPADVGLATIAAGSALLCAGLLARRRRRDG